MQERIRQARENVKAIVAKLGVPEKALKGSEVQVCGSNEKYWYTFVHNGANQDAVRETEVLFQRADAEASNYGFLRLGSSVVKWLTAVQSQ